MTKMARQGIKARTQRTQGIGMPSSASSASACHRHRHAIIGIIGIGIIIGIGKACHHRHAIGNCHRHRHHRQGIGMPSSAAAGRRTAERSKVAQYSHTDFERVLRCAVVKIFE
jgi:hypothetical protein